MIDELSSTAHQRRSIATFVRVHQLDRLLAAAFDGDTVSTAPHDTLFKLSSVPRDAVCRDSNASLLGSRSPPTRQTSPARSPSLPIPELRQRPSCPPPPHSPSSPQRLDSPHGAATHLQLHLGIACPPGERNTPNRSWPPHSTVRCNRPLLVPTFCIAELYSSIVTSLVPLGTLLASANVPA